MINSINNILQIAVLLICVFIALWRSLRLRSRSWGLLAFFFASWVLGDLYWLFCLLFFEATPQISVVAVLSWYAAYIFLYMFLRQTAPPDGVGERRLLPWLGFVFTFAMAVFFMQRGEYLSNLIYATLMGLLLFASIRRLIYPQNYPTQRPLCIAILILCLLEYGLWTASCFWWEETLVNPYYWFDFLLTASFLLFLPAMKKAVVK